MKLRQTAVQCFLVVLVACSVLLLTAPAWPQSSKPSFEKAFADYVRSEGIVGASYVRIDKAGVIRRDFGLSDSSLNQPVDANTIFHWASITKTLTAVAIMQLRDRGKLSLDDSIIKFVPELSRIHSENDAIARVTLRHILSHTAGFQSATWPYTEGKPWQPFEPTEWSQLVAMLPYQELSFQPGTKFQYSNPGFIYLGRVIEKLSGDPYQVYVQKNILSPLGMTRTYFNYSPHHLERYRSNSYAIDIDEQGHDSVHAFGREFNTGITTANGGLNASMEDMAKWIAFLASTHPNSGSSTVLSRSSLSEMWKAVVDVPAEVAYAPPAKMGLSFFLWPRSAGGATETFVGHTGHQAGFATFFVLNPLNGAAIVVATNTVRNWGEKEVQRKRYEDNRRQFNALMESALEAIRQ
ncbi:MAG: beta-lactamase family protein [Acidobacteria bacterium]|nr:beta-lactamase family protein [Acidobacteriota bacterium]